MGSYRGKHLVVSRGLYSHHGIGLGSGRVIHYAGWSDGPRAGPICEVTLEQFSGGARITVQPHPGRRYAASAAVARARSRLGEDAYSVWGNNCEHFVEWCIDGLHQSDQVDGGVNLAGGGLSFAAARGGVGVVGVAGSVAGLSGSGIMSGLASVGAVVGGGAVAGVGVLGGTGGLGMAVLLNNTVLKEDDRLPDDEREARRAGRVASYTGVATGTAASVASISVAGSVAGLSGSGIASGLAAIGATVGGGMAAGVALTVATPVAASALLGYGVYKGWQRISTKPAD